MKPLTLIRNGHRVECFGSIAPTRQSIQVACDRADDSGIWSGGNPTTGSPFRNWAEALLTIEAAIDGTITQLEIL